VPQFSRLRKAVRGLLSVFERRNSKTRSKRNVEYHYDIDDRIYSLFLDQDRQYSCAYFESEDQSLDDAQEAKKRHISAKLKIQPGQRVLDIGSGWGGLAMYIGRHFGADVVGLTLSEEQLKVSSKRASADGLSKIVKFRLQDFRNVDEKFDRIVSVGMFEHVGKKEYPTFFDVVRRSLKENGIVLLHTIGRLDGKSTTNPWFAKYIFPGSYVPALSEILPIIEKSGLIVTDIEILRLHYARTLSHWRSRFMAHRAEAAAILGERFCRMWEYYLAASEAGFRYGGLVVFQVQLAGRLETVPRTRRYILEEETRLRHEDEVIRGVAAE
jgi:cyclopropane-fatty-acyl-phospholipid synthase